MSYIHRAYTRCDVFWLSRADDSDPSKIQAATQNLLDATITRKGSSVQTVGDEYGGWLETGGLNDVTSCSWNKDTSQPAGVFSLSLVPRKDYKRLILPGDVFLVFAGNEERAHTRAQNLLTVGIVDRVSESRAVNGDGSTGKRVSISGRDFGKVLLETQTAFDPAFAHIEQTLFTAAVNASLLDRQGVPLSPCEAVLSVLDLYFTETTEHDITHAQWRFPGAPDVSMLSLLDTKNFVQAPLFGYSFDLLSATIQGGNLWHLCDSFANRVVNEMFIDIRELSEEERSSREFMESVVAAFLPDDDVTRQRNTRDQTAIAQSLSLGAQEARELDRARSVIALVMRQLPYDVDAFYALPVHEVHESEVFETDFGKATHDVVNFIRLRVTQADPIFQETNYGIAVNPTSSAAFGLKRLEAETLYGYHSSRFAEEVLHGETEVGPGSWDPTYNYYVGLLATWHAFNDLLEAGSIALRYRPEIRVGRRLEYTFSDGKGNAERIDFYIQGVQHVFHEEAGASRTMLNVVRGRRVPLTGGAVDKVKKDTVPVHQQRWSKEKCGVSGAFNPWVTFASSGIFNELRVLPSVGGVVQSEGLEP
jgi:hypothetical protein